MGRDKWLSRQRDTQADRQTFVKGGWLGQHYGARQVDEQSLLVAGHLGNHLVLQSVAHPDGGLEERHSVELGLCLLKHRVLERAPPNQNEHNHYPPHC